VQNYPLSDDAPLSDGLTRFLEESNVLSAFFMNFVYDANQNGNNNLRRLLELELAVRQEESYQARRNWLSAIHAANEIEWQSQFEALALEQSNDEALTYLTSSVLESNNVLAQNYINQLEDSELKSTWNILLNANASLNAAEQNALMTRYLAEETDFGLALSKLNSESESILWPTFDLTHWMSRSAVAEKLTNDLSDTKKEWLQIFPNPGDDVVYLTFDVQWTDKGFIQIFDAQGRLVQSLSTNKSGIQELQVKDWADGIYAINLVYETFNISTLKFIKH